MTSYQEDLVRLRKEFARVDVKSIDSIQKWFANHPHLSTNDHAQIANKSTTWIRELKRKAFIRGRTPANIPKPSPRRSIVKIDVPPNWDTKEWLEKAIKLYSIKAIAKAVGLSNTVINKRVKRYGLTPSPIFKQATPKNPCCTKQWCYDHYITQKLSQTTCAKLAGICQQTFANWLNRFKIPVRSHLAIAANRSTVTIWAKKLVYNLRQQHTIVNRVKFNIDKDSIAVSYKTRLHEYYWLHYPSSHKRQYRHFYVPTHIDADIKKIPQIRTEFEDALDGSISYPAHVMIPYDEFYKSTFMEQRIALHMLTRVVCRRDWLPLTYPQHVISAEWDKLLNCEARRYYFDGMFSVHPRTASRETSGLRIIEHFFGLDELASFFRSPKRTLASLNYVVKKKLDITMHNMIRATTIISRNLVRCFTMKVWDPGVYYWIFKHLGTKGTVLDLYPQYGHKAMACALAGLKYTAIPNPHFQKALDNGFAEFIGLDYEPYTGQNIDLLINDNDFKGTELSDASPYISKAKKLLYYVPRDSRAEMANKYKPQSIIPVKTRRAKRLPDYLFLL